jgi:flagellin-like hook-associated protein FlgL
MKFKDFLQKKGITEDAFGKMDASEQAKLHGEYLGELSSSIEGKASKEELEQINKAIEEVKNLQPSVTAEQFKQLQDDLKKANEVIEAQGKEIVELGKTTERKGMKTLADAFKEKYDELAEEKEYGGAGKAFETPHGQPITIELKEIVSTDVMSVDTVDAADFPLAGSTGVVNSTLGSIYARIIGFFTPRRVYSRIMDYVDVQPLTEATLIAINETITGTAEVTPECELKAIVKANFTTQEATADPVTAMWFTTTKLRRFFSALVNRMEQTFARLVNEEVPNAVLAAVRTGATAFTPNAALAINENPNNYDAIGAVIASLENLNWQPNVVMVNPIAWRNMKQDKTADGIYTLWNGQSVSILQDRIDWGGFMVQVIKDPALGVDEFIVGDFMETVKVGVDSQLMYMETDGRVDAQATTAVSGLARNIRSHVLEKFVAVIIPTATNAGLVRDTFSNVKTLITSEPTT